MKYLFFVLLVLCPTIALALDPAYKPPVNDRPVTAGAAMHERQGAIGARSGEPSQAIATNPPDNCIQDIMLKKADWERRHQRAINDSVPEEDYYVKPTWDPETGALTQMIYSPNRHEGDNKPEYGYRIINGRLAPNSDVNNRGPLLSPKQREEINADLASSSGCSYVNEQDLKVQNEQQLKVQNEQQLKAQNEQQLKAQNEQQLKAQNEQQLKAQNEQQLKVQNEQQLKVQAKSYISGRQRRKAKPKNTGQRSKPSAKSGSVHYVNVPKCYVRRTPDNHSPVIAELLEYDWVKLLKTKSSWCQVETGTGSVGWLNKNLIK
jgi:Bacterial SH3 domain